MPTQTSKCCCGAEFTVSYSGSDWESIQTQTLNKWLVTHAKCIEYQKPITTHYRLNKKRGE
jgi:hypothetical protein